VLPVSDAIRDGWWGKDVDDHEAHTTFVKIADRVRENDYGRRCTMVEQLVLYSNQAIDEFGTTDQTGAFERISENHIENIVHALHAETEQNRTRMTVVTSGGDYRMKKRAKSLDKFSEGQAYEDSQEDVGSDVKLDTIIWGTGVEFMFKDPSTGRVSCERDIPWDWHFDKDDARHRRPRMAYRTKVFDREVLKAAFNSKETDDAIDGAPRSNVDDYPYQIDSQSNLILVHEGWHLPSLSTFDEDDDEESEDDDKKRAKKARPEPRKGLDDGCHMIAVGASGKGGILFRERWTRPRFPAEFIYWMRPRIGMWGKGVVAQLLGQQVEYNRIRRHIQLSMKRAGNLKVFIDSRSGVLKTHINDRIGTIGVYNGAGGNPPTYLVHDVVTPQIVAYADAMPARMYTVQGVSQMAAQGTLPIGMDKASGRAIRMADSVASRRRLPFLRDCEKFDRRVAEFKIELAQEIFKETGSYAVAHHGKRKIEIVDWKDVNLKRDQWFMRVYPTSALPNEPSARIATLDEWLNAGLIDKPTYKRLADFPDLEDASTLESAAYELAEEFADRCLYDGELMTLEPLMDAVLIARVGHMAYCRAKLEGVFHEKNMGPLRHLNHD
jgi:hypothetical protein